MDIGGAPLHHSCAPNCSCSPSSNFTVFIPRKVRARPLPWHCPHMGIPATPTDSRSPHERGIPPTRTRRGTGCASPGLVDSDDEASHPPAARRPPRVPAPRGHRAPGGTGRLPRAPGGTRPRGFDEPGDRARTPHDLRVPGHRDLPRARGRPAVRRASSMGVRRSVEPDAKARRASSTRSWWD